MAKAYETDNLVLRVIDGSRAGQALDYYMRNRDFLEEWEAAKGEDFYTVEYHKNQLDRDHDAIENGAALRLWIYKKDDDSKIIGAVALNNIVRGAFLSCHLGYKLDKDEINKGYVTEAIRKTVEIAFNELGLHRIEANIMPKNTRSLRVVEKLGFYNEGLAYKYLKINGKWEDHIHMVLLNDKV